MQNGRTWGIAVLAAFLAASTLSVSGTSIQMSPFVGRRTEGLYRAASYNRAVDQYNRQAEEDYTIKIGNLRLQLTLGLEAKYDDNVTAADSNTEGGLSLTPLLCSEIYWPLNPGFQVYSGLSLGYKWYALGGEDANDKGITVGGTDGAVNMQVGFDLRLGQDGLLSASEEFARDLDVFDGGSAQQNRNYTLNRNLLNLQYRNDFTHYTNGAAKFTHTNQWTDQKEFNEQDLYSDFLDLALLHFLNRSLQLGPYGRAGMYHYTEDKHNNSDSLAGGLAMVYGTTDRFVVSGSVGLSDVSFDTGNNAAATDSYLGLTTEWAILYASSPVLTHRLVTTYGAEQGTLSQNVNFAKEWLTQYTISYVLRENLLLNADLGYINTHESDGGSAYDLYRTGVGLAYRFTRNTTMDLRYIRDWRTSNDGSGGDYTRNAVILRLMYRL